MTAATGCAPSPVRLEPAVRARLKDEPAIHQVQYPPAVIRVRTRLGDAVRSLNPYGGVAPDSSHPSPGLTRESALVDPAGRLGEQFLAAVTPRLGLDNLRAVPHVLDNDEPEAIRAVIPAGLVLDFRTMAWLVRYDPNRFSSYFVAYVGRARLIRMDGGQVLWQAMCRAPYPKEAGPTLDELKAYGGTLLRWKSEEQADRCAAELVEQFFGQEPGGG